ncbi:hypothetical protein AGOR_G00102190 [Albula goreensis]|uniref:Uncharacterized protein n=1 Tax=Albula goreensis TaxID=1534307 RepID=A0A8T3DDZ9_9TELE|nr:hypothetical protein AGOR_G00102190 [Albula goreensis]
MNKSGASKFKHLFIKTKSQDKEKKEGGKNVSKPTSLPVDGQPASPTENSAHSPTGPMSPTSPASMTPPGDMALASPTEKKKRRFKWPKRKSSRSQPHDDPLFFNDSHDNEAMSNHMSFDQLSVQTEYSERSDCESQLDLESASMYSFDMAHHSSASRRARKSSEDKPGVLVRIGSFFSSRRRKSSKGQSETSEDEVSPTKNQAHQFPSKEGPASPPPQVETIRISLPELCIERSELKPSASVHSIVSILDGEGIPFVDSDSSGRSSVKGAGSQEALGGGDPDPAEVVLGGVCRKLQAYLEETSVSDEGATTIKKNFQVAGKAKGSGSPRSPGLEKTEGGVARGPSRPQSLELKENTREQNLQKPQEEECSSGEATPTNGCPTPPPPKPITARTDTPVSPHLLWVETHLGELDTPAPASAHAPTHAVAVPTGAASASLPPGTPPPPVSTATPQTSDMEGRVSTGSADPPQRRSIKLSQTQHAFPKSLSLGAEPGAHLPDGPAKTQHKSEVKLSSSVKKVNLEIKRHPLTRSSSGEKSSPKLSRNIIRSAECSPKLRCATPPASPSSPASPVSPASPASPVAPQRLLKARAVSARARGPQEPQAVNGVPEAHGVTSAKAAGTPPRTPPRTPTSPEPLDKTPDALKSKIPKKPAVETKLKPLTELKQKPLAETKLKSPEMKPKSSSARATTIPDGGLTAETQSRTEKGAASNDADPGSTDGVDGKTKEQVQSAVTPKSKLPKATDGPLSPVRKARGKPGDAVGKTSAAASSSPVRDQAETPGSKLPRPPQSPLHKQPSNEDAVSADPKSPQADSKLKKPSTKDSPKPQSDNRPSNDEKGPAKAGKVVPETAQKNVKEPGDGPQGEAKPGKGTVESVSKNAAKEQNDGAQGGSKLPMPNTRSPPKPKPKPNKRAVKQWDKAQDEAAKLPDSPAPAGAAEAGSARDTPSTEAQSSTPEEGGSSATPKKKESPLCRPEQPSPERRSRQVMQGECPTHLSRSPPQHLHRLLRLLKYPPQHLNSKLLQHLLIHLHRFQHKHPPQHPLIHLNKQTSQHLKRHLNSKLLQNPVMYLHKPPP